jgi:hypothetical protein
VNVFVIALSVQKESKLFADYDEFTFRTFMFRAKKKVLLSIFNLEAMYRTKNTRIGYG